MRKLDFINGESSFGQDLPEKAIKVLRTVAKLESKELCKALAANTADLGAQKMEVP